MSGMTGLGAMFLAALGRPPGAKAADGDTVTVGATLSGTGATRIVSTGSPAFHAQTSATGTGIDNTGMGLLGYANATTGYNVGVRGISLGPQGAGVLGQSFGTNGAGVSGLTRDGNGVHGHSDSNTGVLGDSDTSRGVWGKSPVGVGVIGSTDSGVGVLASAATGRALSVNGKAQFLRAGRTSVPAGKAFVDVIVQGGLDTESGILATLQLYRPGVYVAAVRVNVPSSGKARIYLNKIASSIATTPVAWFVIS